MVGRLISQHAFKEPLKSQSTRNGASGWLGKFTGSGDYSSLFWKALEEERGSADQAALRSVPPAATIASGA